MPEGDSIHRIAGRLASMINGRIILEATSSEPRVAARTLVGVRVTDAQAHGKHMLISLEDGTTLHAHLGVSGSWHRYPDGDAWERPAHRASLVLRFEGFVVICFSAEILERIPTLRLPGLPFITRLGPDILAKEFDAAAAVARMRAKRHIALGVQILDQTVLGGVGNVYKSEGLYLARLDPFSYPEDHPDEVLQEWIETTRRLMARHVQGRPRRTRDEPHGPRTWVYGRIGEPCLGCGTRVQMRRQGAHARSTYWCPTCQPAVHRSGRSRP